METLIKLHSNGGHDYLESPKKLYKISKAKITNDLPLSDTEIKTKLKDLKALFARKQKNFNHKLF